MNKLNTTESIYKNEEIKNERKKRTLDRRKKKKTTIQMRHKNPLAFKGIFGIEPKQVIRNGLFLW